MLHLVGLGLGSFEDVTLRGLKAIEASEILYLESYTSIQPGLDRDSLVSLRKVGAMACM